MTTDPNEPSLEESDTADDQPELNDNSKPDSKSLGFFGTIRDTAKRLRKPGSIRRPGGPNTGAKGWHKQGNDDR